VSTQRVEDVNPAEWISQAEAARIRGVTRQAIAKLVKSRRIRTLLIGGHILVNREDVLNFTRRPAGRRRVSDA